MIRDLTENEINALSATANLWASFLILPQICEDDTTEFRHHLHALQNIIFSRPTFEAFKKSDRYENHNINNIG